MVVGTMPSTHKSFILVRLNYSTPERSVSNSNRVGVGELCSLKAYLPYKLLVLQELATGSVTPSRKVLRER